MPRKRRLIRLKDSDVTPEQQLALICGPGINGEHGRNLHFLDKEDMHHRWLQAREELMQHYGHGMWAFWYFDAGEFPRSGETLMHALLRLKIPPTAVDFRNERVQIRGRMTDLDLTAES